MTSKEIQIISEALADLKKHMIEKFDEHIEEIKSWGQPDLPDGINPDDLPKVVESNLDLTEPH